ncbi:MAG: hypothetical protein IKR59_09085, partial [Lachnospiraceae bacterium]|nr:hypothetical protein [Lachnospiraceae bacterium]
MFFTEYHPMTTEAVDQAVSAKRCADGGSFLLEEGLTFSLNLTGDFAPEELSYKVLAGGKLEVRENGSLYTAPYAALQFGPIVLLSHLCEGSSHGYHFVWDRRDDAVTVFESWFGITVPVGFDMSGKNPPLGTRDIPREVQREYWFGKAVTGKETVSAHLHETTNRMEGKGLYWKDEDGSEMLSFHPSVICSTIVELGQEMGGITMSNPSDYVRIDDRFFIYTRYECEFSGKMWLWVLDYFDFKAAGLELGFDEEDHFIYRLHRADFEVTGNAAHMEMITDNGTERPVMHFRGPSKGARYAYRPMDIDIPMTQEEAYAHAREKQRILQGPVDGNGCPYHTLPFTDALVGKHFTVVPDREKYAAAPWNGKNLEETVWEYEIISADTLRYRFGGGDWNEEKYVCYEVDPELFFMGHMVTGAEDFATVAQAVDFRTGLTTTIRTGIGNWRSEWEVGSEVSFGTLKYPGVKPPFARRHHFTDELVGCCFAWDYTDKMYSIHLYSAPESYSWTIFRPDNSGGATWSSP